MQQTKEINALFTLIDDPDHEVYSTVSEKIVEFGKGIIPNLEDLWENTLSEDVQERIEMLIHRLHYTDLTQYQAGKTTETNFAGVAYSNLLPVYNDFIKAIGDKKDFYAFEKYKLAGNDFDFEKKIFSGSVQLQNVYNENGLIMVTAKIDGVDNTTFRVISFTDNQFIISYKDGERIYNYRITI